MNTFNRKSLYAALAGLSALGATGAAEAVNLSADGLGQVLIYPYYTVRNGPQGFPYNTLLTVVNTTLSAKAVKVRFLEGKNSKEVLDFNLFLSKNDVWTAALVATADGAAVTSTDTSCILPGQLPAAGQPFVNFAYAGDGADDTLDRTREGYVEIIEMATFANGSTTQINITHVGGTPPGCADQTDAQANLDKLPGNGGLMGTMTIYSAVEGSSYSQNATALDNFNKTAPIYFNAGLPAPSLSDAFPATSAVINSKSGSATTTQWGLSPINAVSAVLMHDAVLNEYVTEPTILGATDWVVTMPTKNQYVKVGTGAATPPFQRNFNGTAGACDDVSLSTWDREERSPSTPGGFSPPPPPGKASSLCWEANVITFQATSVLGSKNTRLANLNTAQNQINGWARLGFIHTNALLVGGATGVQDLYTFALTNTPTSTYVGLPTIGFAVQVYQNPAIVVNGKAVLSNYGSDYAHRYSSAIIFPAPAP
jgi:hypothetical protein